MEELFWRSLVMRWIARRDFLALAPRAAGLTAFALSSALFALEHSQWLAGLAAGMAYGWLYMRSGNLWIPILSHATTNGILALWIVATGSWRFW
jgi:CAAX prenyl protease-like protein